MRYFIVAEMRWAALTCRIAERSFRVGRPRDVFDAATLGGARFLGRDDLGRLARGAKADVVVINLRQLHHGAVHDPIKSLVECGTGGDVETVIVDGQVLVESGRAVRMDEDALLTPPMIMRREEPPVDDTFAAPAGRTASQAVIAGRFFAPLPAERRGAVLDRFAKRSVTAGTTVIRQGEFGHPLVLVTTGRLDVRAELASGEVVQVLSLGAGDLLFWPPTTHTRKELVRRLRHVPLATSFRASYAYDNVLYPVAGELIEAVSGKTWEEFVADEILAKVGMEHSTVNNSDLKKADNAATPHAPIDGEVRPIEPFYIDNSNPAGGINSCAADEAKWNVLRELASEAFAAWTRVKGRGSKGSRNWPTSQTIGASRLKRPWPEVG